MKDFWLDLLLSLCAVSTIDSMNDNTLPVSAVNSGSVTSSSYHEVDSYFVLSVPVCVVGSWPCLCLEDLVCSSDVLSGPIDAFFSLVDLVLCLLDDFR